MSPAARAAFKEAADALAKDLDADAPELARAVRSFAANVAAAPAPALPMGDATARWCRTLSRAAAIAAREVASREDSAELLAFAASIAP